jgi:hypothetical protein
MRRAVLASVFQWSEITTWMGLLVAQSIGISPLRLA